MHRICVKNIAKTSFIAFMYLIRIKKYSILEYALLLCKVIKNKWFINNNLKWMHCNTLTNGYSIRFVKR